MMTGYIKTKKKVVAIVNVSHDPLDHSCQIGIWQSCRVTYQQAVDGY